MRQRPHRIIGHRIAAPRLTAWVPLLAALCLSLPVALATIIGALM